MNKITITNTTINANRLTCSYNVEGEWEKYFKKDELFFAEYSQKIEGIPENVAVIPFLCNILPIAWIFDAEIILEEIDKAFYESIDEFKKGYIEMYPQIDFRGRINYKKLIDNRQEDANNSVAFFSGGVDAFNTLISHIDERPCLATVWGADITFEDEKGWELVSKHTVKTAEENGLDYILIKSSFRRFTNESALVNYVMERTGDGWWHGFQHGIGLLGHLAPLAYHNKIKTVYIASSFTAGDKGKVTCASDPSIDNYVRFCDCRVVHDGYEFNRQDKIQRICEYVKRTGKPIQLRVCWESKGGSNCCFCEKCYRTLMGIIAEKEDPNNYGFNYNDDDFTKMMLDMRKRIQLRIKSRYGCIQKKLRANYSIDQLDKRIRWFYRLDIEWEDKKSSMPFFKAISKTRRFLGKIKKKLVH